MNKKYFLLIRLDIANLTINCP